MPVSKRSRVQHAAAALHTPNPPPDRRKYIAHLTRLRCSGATDAIVYLLEQHAWWDSIEMYLLVRRVTRCPQTRKVQRLASSTAATRLPPDARALLMQRLARPQVAD